MEPGGWVGRRELQMPMGWLVAGAAARFLGYARNDYGGRWGEWDRGRGREIGDNGWRWGWSRAAGSGCGGGGLGIMDGDGDGAGLLGREAGVGDWG